MLSIFERKILKRIYGPIPDKGRWPPRWNSGIYNLYKDLNIGDDIQIRRLGRAGHIIRMVSERISKKCLMGNFIIQVQWENQEQVGMTSSGQTHHRSYSI
jgi:hypothetical protein